MHDIGYIDDFGRIDESGTASLADDLVEDPKRGGSVIGNKNDAARWENIYCALDLAARKNDYRRAVKLCKQLCDNSWGWKILQRPWNKTSSDKPRSWKGEFYEYPPAYRLIDGIRETWVCLLMDNCEWSEAVKVCNDAIADSHCRLLSTKGQMVLNKLHALLESRENGKAFEFLQQLDTHGMLDVNEKIKEMNPYQYHYTFARIHFLHNVFPKAQWHAEQACQILEANNNDPNNLVEEPLQSRFWVNMIRAHTRGFTAVLSNDFSAVSECLELWEKSVCDLDRTAVKSTAYLTETPTFGRLKFVEFLIIAIRAFPEIEVRSYADSQLPKNNAAIKIGQKLISQLRALTRELLREAKVSVEVTNSRYNSTIDQAQMYLGYLSSSLTGMINNWTLVVDAETVGNEARFANHTDDPNSVLALGMSGGVRTRILRAAKPIAKNDEITVHYGSDYWDNKLENRSSFSEFEMTAAKISPASKKSGGNSTNNKSQQSSPATSSFTYYDGVIPDMSGSGLPPLLLLQMLGEHGGRTSELPDMDAALKRKGLRVEQCPKDHPAFPGKRLIADRDFSPGEEICVYGGVLTKAPVQQTKLNESDYISTVYPITLGSYGFELEDLSGSSGMVLKPYQQELPSLTPAGCNRGYMMDSNPPVDLSKIVDIKGLGPEVTKLLLRNLVDPSKHDVMRTLLRQIRKLSQDAWRSEAGKRIRKTLSAKKLESKGKTTKSPTGSVPAGDSLPSTPERMDERKYSLEDQSLVEDMKPTSQNQFLVEAGIETPKTQSVLEDTIATPPKDRTTVCSDISRNTPSPVSVVIDANFETQPFGSTTQLSEEKENNPPTAHTECISLCNSDSEQQTPTRVYININPGRQPVRISVIAVSDISEPPAKRRMTADYPFIPEQTFSCPTTARTSLDGGFETEFNLADWMGGGSVKSVNKDMVGGRPSGLQKPSVLRIHNQ